MFSAVSKRVPANCFLLPLCSSKCYQTTRQNNEQDQQTDSTDKHPKYPLRIKLFKQTHFLPSDIVNFLENPALTESDVRAEYPRDFLRRGPQIHAWWVLYKDETQRDAAWELSRGKTMFGSRIELERATISEFERATSTYPRGAARGTVVLLSSAQPVTQMQVEDFVQEFSLAKSATMLEAGGQPYRAFVYFSDADEAQRAIRTKHLQQIAENIRAELRVLL